MGHTRAKMHEIKFPKNKVSQTSHKQTSLANQEKSDRRSRERQREHTDVAREQSKKSRTGAVEIECGGGRVDDSLNRSAKSYRVVALPEADEETARANRDLGHAFRLPDKLSIQQVLSPLDNLSVQRGDDSRRGYSTGWYAERMRVHANTLSCNGESKEHWFWGAGRKSVREARACARSRIEITMVSPKEGRRGRGGGVVGKRRALSPSSRITQHRMAKSHHRAQEKESARGGNSRDKACA